jgi:hypothetical protein
VKKNTSVDCLNPCEAEAHLNNIQKLSSDIKGNTARLHYIKINWLMLFKEIIAVYPKNRAKLINTLYAQNAELLNVKVGGTYSYHWALPT